MSKIRYLLVPRHRTKYLRIGVAEIVLDDWLLCCERYTERCRDPRSSILYNMLVALPTALDRHKYSGTQSIILHSSISYGGLGYEHLIGMWICIHLSGQARKVSILIVCRPRNIPTLLFLFLFFVCWAACCRIIFFLRPYVVRGSSPLHERGVGGWSGRINTPLSFLPPPCLCVTHLGPFVLRPCLHLT